MNAQNKARDKRRAAARRRERANAQTRIQLTNRYCLVTHHPAHRSTMMRVVNELKALNDFVMSMTDAQGAISI